MEVGIIFVWWLLLDAFLIVCLASASKSRHHSDRLFCEVLVWLLLAQVLWPVWLCRKLRRKPAEHIDVEA